MTASPRFDLSNAEWLAHRYIESEDRVRFVRVPRERHREIAFLVDDLLGPDLPTHEMPAAEALREAGPGPLCWLFHSAFCGSTMLVRALDRPGAAMGLSEPVILNDLVGFRRRGAPPREVARLADLAGRLLARPFAAGEAVVVKPSNVLNPLTRLMLSLRSDAPAIGLYAPLETFLVSVARKGLECRAWGRELLEGYLGDGFAPFGFSAQDYFRQTDLQVAALGWLAQHRQFAALAAEFGARFATLDADRLADDPAAAIGAAARHYGLALDAAAVDEIAHGPAFTRHSKSGAAYGPEARARDYDAARTAYGDEIGKVTVWAEAVAASAGIALEPPRPLL
ncbi:MAG TPA: hypothetical protein VM055_04040 [Novosphingobium sp.]|nr:hypothetical protein [Novosphingobium sp.]